MPVPTVYTEQTLAEFMMQELKNSASDLGWTTADPDGDYQEAITETLLLYGVADVSEATNIRKVRALARVAIWESATKASVPNTDSSQDGMSNSDSQVYDHSYAMWEEAKQQASIWMDNDSLYPISSVSISNQVVF